MKVTFDKDGFVTDVHASDGINEYELGALHVLNICDGLTYDEAVAFLATITSSIADKYHKIDTSLATDLTLCLVNRSISKLEDIIEKCQ